jgi:hypothetical protein
MNKKQYLSLLFAAIISGLFGGAGFSWLFSGRQVSAQTNPSTVAAQEFRLVDANGKLRAILSDNQTLARGTPSLVFYDTNQKARLAVGAFRTNGEPSIQLMDENEMAAFLLTRFQGTTILQLSNISAEPIDGGVARSSVPALWLTQSIKDGANIKIFGKSDKVLWSARK